MNMIMPLIYLELTEFLSPMFSVFNVLEIFCQVLYIFDITINAIF